MDSEHISSSSSNSEEDPIPLELGQKQINPQAAFDEYYDTTLKNRTDYLNKRQHNQTKGCSAGCAMVINFFETYIGWPFSADKAILKERADHANAMLYNTNLSHFRITPQKVLRDKGIDKTDFRAPWDTLSNPDTVAKHQLDYELNPIHLSTKQIKSKLLRHVDVAGMYGGNKTNQRSFLGALAGKIVQIGIAGGLAIPLYNMITDDQPHQATDVGIATLAASQAIDLLMSIFQDARDYYARNSFLDDDAYLNSQFHKYITQHNNQVNPPVYNKIITSPGLKTFYSSKLLRWLPKALGWGAIEYVLYVVKKSLQDGDVFAPMKGQDYPGVHFGCQLATGVGISLSVTTLALLSLIGVAKLIPLYKKYVDFNYPPQLLSYLVTVITTIATSMYLVDNLQQKNNLPAVWQELVAIGTAIVGGQVADWIVRFIYSLVHSLCCSNFKIIDYADEEGEESVNNTIPQLYQESFSNGSTESTTVFVPKSLPTDYLNDTEGNGNRNSWEDVEGFNNQQMFANRSLLTREHGDNNRYYCFMGPDVLPGTPLDADTTLLFRHGVPYYEVNSETDPYGTIRGDNKPIFVLDKQLKPFGGSSCGIDDFIKNNQNPVYRCEYFIIKSYQLKNGIPTNVVWYYTDGKGELPRTPQGNQFVQLAQQDTSLMSYFYSSEKPQAVTYYYDPETDDWCQNIEDGHSQRLVVLDFRKKKKAGWFG